MVFRKFKDKFHAYLNKADFDHRQRQIDPLEYHSMFITLATLFNVMDYEKISWWMHISPIFIFVGGLSAGTLFLISVVHYVQIFQIYYLTECGTYLLMMGLQLLVNFSIKRGKKNYHNLLQALREDFQYIFSKRAQKYRDQFFENQLLTFRGCIAAVIMTYCTAGGMIICFFITAPIVNKGNDVRLLMFPYWIFDKDLQASPAYEIVNCISLVIILMYAYLYMFLLISYIVWIRAITCKADIINWNLQDLMVDVLPANNNEEKDYYAKVIKHRMREILVMHHSMLKLIDDFAAVFKMGLFYEQVMASPVICMTGYCFTAKYEQGEIEVFLLVLCVGSCVVVFVPNFLCTHLLEKVQSVSDACWDMPFWNAGPVIRSYLVLMMQRSIRPLPIAAAGFDNVSLQTYSTMLTRAYSCFNMLRQADFNNF